MNRFRLTKAGIDYRAGVDRFSGDRALFESLLAMFPDDSSYIDMVAACEAGNVEEAFSCAHTLKGVAGNLSMVRLFDDVVPMVEELRAGNLEKGRKLMLPVSESYKVALDAVNDELQRAAARE